MAEDTTTTEVSATETTDPEPLGDQGKKALDAERRARRAAEKERETLAAQIKELQDRDKTEVQRAADRAAELERINAEAASEVARLRVALRYQIAEEDMDLLGAGTEEQIEARAKRVAELRGAQTPTVPPRTPVESLRPGATPPALPLNGDGLEDAVKATLGIA